MLLNNTPHGYVQLSSSMGLRQMDPLSPYLFLHCVWLDLKRGNGKEKSKGMEIIRKEKENISSRVCLNIRQKGKKLRRKKKNFLCLVCKRKMKILEFYLYTFFYNLMGRDGPEPMIRPLWVAGPIWSCDKDNYP
jgi:hypothetical protein